MDKLVPIRSMVRLAHAAITIPTSATPGRTAQGAPDPARRLALDRLGHDETAAAAPRKEVPPFVGLAPNAGHPPYGSPGHPGFLGPACAAFRPNGAGMSDLTLNGITSDRLADRRALLAELRQIPPRRGSTAASWTALDVFNQQAFNVLTSSKLLDALDVSERRPESRASVTAKATRKTTATARRATTSTSSSPGGSSRPARAA